MSAARRFLPTDLPDFLRSAVPLALLGLAALTASEGSIILWVILVVLILGTVIAARRDAPVRWTWAAALPAGAMMVVPALSPPYLGMFPGNCPVSGPYLVSIVGASAVAVVGTVVALAITLGADRATYFVGMPRRGRMGWVVAGVVAGLVLGGVIVPVTILEFEPAALVDIRPTPPALAQAALFGLATSVTAELALRGTLLGWSARILGVAPAIIGQAVISGFVGVLVLGVAYEPVAAAAYGLLAGIVTVQARSIAVSAATTFGLAFALYLQVVCVS